MSDTPSPKWEKFIGSGGYILYSGSLGAIVKAEITRNYSWKIYALTGGHVYHYGQEPDHISAMNKVEQYLGYPSSISPLGFYRPYVPLQVSSIFKKDETNASCPECSTGLLQETAFEEEGKTVKVIACNRCRYNVVERENDPPTRSPTK